jgi:resolvase-like protein/Homeodomain-like domain-containing protein
MAAAARRRIAAAQRRRWRAFHAAQKQPKSKRPVSPKLLAALCCATKGRLRNIIWHAHRHLRKGFNHRSGLLAAATRSSRVCSGAPLGNPGRIRRPVTQGIDTDESNPTARLMLSLLAAFAEFERELIVERTRAGLQRARRQGRIGGRPRLVVNRARVASLAAEGFTTREIGEELDISAASVCRILKSAV